VFLGKEDLFHFPVLQILYIIVKGIDYRRIWNFSKNKKPAFMWQF